MEDPRLVLGISFRFLAGTVLCVLVAFALAAPFSPSSAVHIKDFARKAVLFKHGDTNYLADTRHPLATVNIGRRSSLRAVPENAGLLFSVLHTNASSISRQIFEDSLLHYVSIGDVFSYSFLETIRVTSSSPKATLERSAEEYLSLMQARHILVDDSIDLSASISSAPRILRLDLAPGPYYASRIGDELRIAKVYRTYEDTFQNFLYGTYKSRDEEDTFTAVETSFAGFGYPAIPVPSRLYSINDDRPFAGYRVAVKDLYDMAGLVTSGGSRAWARISTPARTTAPSLQRIIDLGAISVGRYKMAQFASRPDPWDWQDEHYPFNPRGDGYLTCSASSSGGGCGIAAYVWLDFAVGTDIGSSMRRPAAVSGTYGQRPSQGMMTLEGVMPQGGATDTAGVFARDPIGWAQFSKHWYATSVRQSTEKTGLSMLEVPESSHFPKTILYPVDYLPLNDSAAQHILESSIPT